MSKTYQGCCHCGAFQFSIVVPEIQEVTVCNCSICVKKGYLDIYPSAGSLNVIKGEASLATYKFSDGDVIHKVRDELKNNQNTRLTG